ncbi:hypothetical protein [Streptomyces syringium]|uniref:hypothetical protein n=1 Tax=Streptomyces syringium TaxID=76729 RepID=UPI0037D41264
MTSAFTAYRAYAYPDPAEEEGGGPAWSEIIEVREVSIDHVVADDCEVRDHPEVPLSQPQRDAVLGRLWYRRTGQWEDEGERATAPVEPVHDDR